MCACICLLSYSCVFPFRRSPFIGSDVQSPCSISNTTLLERGKVQPIEETLKKRRLRWLGHVARMDNSRMPKCILFGELDKTRSRHGPQKRWRDNVVSDTKDRQIVDWCDLAQDCRKWRSACSTIPPTEPVTLDLFCNCGKSYRRRQDLTRQARSDRDFT